MSQDVHLRPVEAVKQLVAPQVLLAVLPVIDSVFVDHALKVAGRCGVDTPKSPPSGVVIARTIVLLV